MSPLRIGFILLAAGNSSRMGQPKQLLAHGDTTFLGHTICEMKRTGWPVVAVLGKEAPLLRPIAEKSNVTCVINPDWEEGMASSIRTGLTALTQNHRVNAVLIAACDQPEIHTGVFHAMEAQMLATNAPMVASAYAGTRGIPALFDASCFAGLLKLEGKSGAKSLLTRNPDQCAEIAFEKGALDIDVPDDYSAWLDSTTR